MLEDRSYMRENPYGAQRSVTVILLIVNVAAFVLQSIFYGYPPRIPVGDVFALSVEGLRHGYIWQLFTFQFMHGGIIHLLVNCWVIFVFGRELEQVFGRNRFLTLYFGSGAIGGLLQIFFAVLLPGQFGGAVVGASAGAFGLVAAYAMMYPERPLTMLLFFIIPITLRAKFLLLFFGLFALLGMMLPGSGIAHAAHLGGMLAGMLYVRHGANWQLPRLRIKRANPRPTRTPHRTSAWGRTDAEDELPPEEFLSKEVDPILDKISAHGIQSLTEHERRILEAARAKMAKR